ncbi:PQQ-dependent sugar dehydrogenase [Kineococcus sp. R86509]|uniref:PQQ-dependent sugar dehydrogenase n=1 Tax=Kineococcus sp. R86509 TaxID=3093851 RepID=UPI0036D28BC4
MAKPPAREPIAGSGLRALAAVGAAAFLGLTACTSATPAGPPSTAGTAASGVEVVSTDLEAPWSLAFHERTALVTERDSARVLEIADDGTTREVGVVDGVGGSGEGGLLGIAVLDGDLFAYSTGEGENRVERYELTGEPGDLSLGEGETILAGLDAAGYHNGGRIAFGPDGMLYVTVGDAGDRSSAQDLNSLSGKILRIAPDGSIPVDNPFAGSAVWSYGHRNPQGIAWDEDGTLYASEFGQDTWDELNVVRAGGNYGWPTVEGVAGQEGFVDPVQQWAPEEASPSGIAVSDGAIHIANLRGQRLRDVALDDLGNATERFAGEFGRLRDVVVAPDGSLWMLTNNTDGRGRPSAGDDRVLRVSGG